MPCNNSLLPGLENIDENQVGQLHYHAVVHSDQKLNFIALKDSPIMPQTSMLQNIAAATL